MVEQALEQGHQSIATGRQYRKSLQWQALSKQSPHYRKERLKRFIRNLIFGEKHEH
ncbi:hypothetical protein [Vandammella animalimorsus]|uniref:hypothetical protein n=1 Tax=Vandammella animalimorsus TaxID=2029117 RepID=UPI001557F082|nr:hypothetical protein [Vandammella animalimorsus]